jgi:hypothetical protein
MPRTEACQSAGIDVAAAHFGTRLLRSARCAAVRGQAGPRLQCRIADKAAYYREANEQLLVCVLLEDAAVLDNLDAILAVPGIDLYSIGPNDFSQSHGYRWAQDASGRDARGEGKRHADRCGSPYFIIVEGRRYRSGDGWDCPQNCGNVRSADVATIRGLPLYVGVEVFDLCVGATQT